MIRRYRFYRRRMRVWPSVKLAWRLRHQLAVPDWPVLPPGVTVRTVSEASITWPDPRLSRQAQRTR